VKRLCRVHAVHSCDSYVLQCVLQMLQGVWECALQCSSVCRSEGYTWYTPVIVMCCTACVAVWVTDVAACVVVCVAVYFSVLQ